MAESRFFFPLPVSGNNVRFVSDSSPFNPRPTLVRDAAREAKRQARAGRLAGRVPSGPRSRGFFALLGLIFLGVVFIALPVATRRYTDWLWFSELGFARVFVTKIVAQWALVGVSLLIALPSLYFTARFALRGGDDETRRDDDLRTIGLTSPTPASRPISAVAIPWSIFLAVIMALAASARWRDLLAFFYRTPFGTTDPVFGREVGFYVFTLPVLEGTLAFAQSLVFVALLFVALPIYLARGAVSLRDWKLVIGQRAQLHGALMVAVILILSAIRINAVSIPSLVLSQHAPLVGASYTDLHARLPALRLLSGVAVLAAIPILLAARRRRLMPGLAVTLLGYIGVSILLTWIFPAAYQRLVVQPNELARETPQIAHHIAATRHAWGLNGVERRELSGETQLTAADIQRNRATIDNVRLWDREPLLQTFGQIQSIRTYYDFVGVDDDRYRIDGDLRQVLLSARELNTAALPTRTFINEHLTFTHGMGLTLGPANQVTPEGLPVLWIKDLPPASSVPVRVTRPQIYFGELANEFVMAPTRQREFDYPAGEGDAAIYSSFDGRSGVPLNSFVRRLLFAFRFGSLNILLSRDLRPDTRILYYRTILERARQALPFVRFDQDPYLVVRADGSLMWILDAYTATTRYPYAQPLTDGTNYMRNSVKVTVGAYDGRVRAYIVDPSDPIIRTFSGIYPGLLRPIAELPADLRAHLRYPEDLFRAQTALYATFHMSDPETFYHREDQWQIPGVRRGDATDAFVRHIVMRLPGGTEPEFIMMRPFTPRQKDNLAAWMVARNDGESYGQLVVYRFPRQSLVFGPTQIVNRINQDTEVARQVSLWDQRGSEVIRGELLVIPIEESLIYVQPLYLRAQGGRIPELKRVVVAHEGRVAMEETLERGLARLFAGEAAPPRPVPAAAQATATPARDQLLRQALEHYERARAAQRAEDWATYGSEMRALGNVLRSLEAGTP
ncbi:MAG TPA: UPF0182 family protein [Gemmatimonadaceae bacterium]|nr:UPF0182 family protein [Gemmatimonadaceae bacterium]